MHADAAQEQQAAHPVEVRADGSTDTHHIDEGIRFDVSLDGIKGVKLIAENGKLTAASARNGPALERSGSTVTSSGSSSPGSTRHVLASESSTAAPASRRARASRSI